LRRPDAGRQISIVRRLPDHKPAATADPAEAATIVVGFYIQDGVFFKSGRGCPVQAENSAYSPCFDLIANQLEVMRRTVLSGWQK